MPVQIDNDAKIQGELAKGFGQRHIISVSSTLFYATQINELNQVEVHKTTNGGLSWTLDTTFTGLTAPSYLCLAKSELNDIFLSFINNNLTMLVKKKDNVTGNWSEVRSVAIDAADNTGLISYNRALNRLFLVKSGTNTPYLVTQYSDDYGGTWTTVNSITAGFTTIPKPVLGLDSNPLDGNIVLVWVTSTTEVRNVILNSAGTVITNPDASIGSLSSNGVLGGALAIDSIGNRWRVVYIKDGGGNFNLRIHKSTTQSLNVNYGVTDTLSYGMLSIGVDGADNVYIAYVKKADSKAYFRKFTASLATWGAETALTTGEGLRPSYEQLSLPSNNKLNFIFFSS